MQECYVIKRHRKQYGHTAREYKIDILDVLVHEYLVPCGILGDIRFKLIKRNLSKKGIVIDDGFQSNKSLLLRCASYIIEYAVKVYGFPFATLSVGLVIKEYNESIKRLILTLSHKVRFLIIYGCECKGCFYDVMQITGLCITFSSFVEPNEKIVIYTDENIGIKIMGKFYYDVDITYAFTGETNDNTIFDNICHEFASENDIKNIFDRGYVKKMALKSK